MSVELLVEPGVEPRLDRAAVENARLVRQVRDRLLAEAGAVTTAMLAEGRGSTTNAARQWLHRHRTAGRLVSVEHDGRTLVPTYQLDEAFDLHPVVARTTQRLTREGMSPWAVWSWFYAHNGWIDERPVDAARRGDQDAVGRAVAGLLDA
jgi:hypothetical protein